MRHWVIFVVALGGVMMSVSYTAVASSQSRKGELILYLGQTRVNSYADPHSLSVSVDFRQRISPRLEYSVMLINEGNPHGFPKRDGIAGEIWWRLPFTDVSHRLVLTLGTGPYMYYATMKEATPSGYADEHRLGWLVSANVGYTINRHLTLNAGWIRVGTGNSTDTDIPRVGIGYRE